MEKITASNVDILLGCWSASWFQSRGAALLHIIDSSLWEIPLCIELVGLIAAPYYGFDVGALHGYTRLVDIFHLSPYYHADISHAMHAMIKYLSNRGEKNVLVKKEGAAAIDPDWLANYSTVEIMNSCIEKYCDIYAKDLALLTMSFLE